MASPTRWTRVWVSSGSWWWTGRLGVLRFTGSQRVGHDWVTELNLKQSYSFQHIIPFCTGLLVWSYSCRSLFNPSAFSCWTQNVTPNSLTETARLWIAPPSSPLHPATLFPLLGANHSSTFWSVQFSALAPVHIFPLLGELFPCVSLKAALLTLLSQRNVASWWNDLKAFRVYKLVPIWEWGVGFHWYCQIMENFVLSWIDISCFVFIPPDDG